MLLVLFQPAYFDWPEGLRLLTRKRVPDGSVTPTAVGSDAVTSNYAA